VSRRERPTVRTCLQCGSPLSLELGFSSFCSASCVWEGERLRQRTMETLTALRAEAEERSRARKPRRSLFGRLRGQVELDEDAATVVAMQAAGATVWQIARYTTLEPSDVERLLSGDGGGPAARAEARERLRLAAAESRRRRTDDEDIAQAS
jgi:hypothetical protein